MMDLTGSGVLLAFFNCCRTPQWGWLMRIMWLDAHSLVLSMRGSVFNHTIMQEDDRISAAQICSLSEEH